MFWNKIPKGYVETVDGYLIKESEAKSVIEYGTITYYRKENAPAYDMRCLDLKNDLFGYKEGFYKHIVQVKEDGTPIGYHTQEEVQKLKDRIKELEDKYEPKFTMSAGTCGTFDPVSDIIERLNKQVEDLSECYPIEKSKPKNKRGRPKKK